MADQTPEPLDDATRRLLRHTLATLAYRASKVLRDVPEGFAAFRAAPASRSAIEILFHMGDLMGWADRLAHGEYRWEAGTMTDWPSGVDRFFALLAAVDAALADTSAASFSADVMFQGPIADALTHVGQLAMMRGMAGAAVRPESYARATIETGRVGREQAPPGREFDGDASKPAR
jgi:hypothetical protein